MREEPPPGTGCPLTPDDDERDMRPRPQRSCSYATLQQNDDEARFEEACTDLFLNEILYGLIA